MTIRTREQAAKAAEKVHRYRVGYCQVFTRECFGLETGVGDVDGDGDADAVDGWLSEPVSARHPGDRNPPRGVPVAFSGGSKGYGHRAMSVGGGLIRSTDMGSLGKYNPGLVSTVSIGDIEAAMNVRYTGWTETISGQVIPGAPKPVPQPEPHPPPIPSAGPLTLASFNMYVGNKAPARNVGRMLKATGYPVAATLQEAARFSAETVTAGSHAYRVIRASDDARPDVAEQTPSRDVLSSAVVVRSDVTVRKIEARQVPGGEWTWNGNKRAARVWVRVVCELDGVVFEVWSIHRCPGGPNPGIVGNRAAWDAEDAFLLTWVGRVLEHNPGRRIHLGGDWNTWRGKMPNHATSIETLATRLGADAHLSRIDGYLSINAPVASGRPKGKPRKVKVRKLVRKFGSDAHRPVVVTFP